MTQASYLGELGKLSSDILDTLFWPIKKSKMTANK